MKPTRTLLTSNLCYQRDLCDPSGLCDQRYLCDPSGLCDQRDLCDPSGLCDQRDLCDTQFIGSHECESRRESSTTSTWFSLDADSLCSEFVTNVKHVLKLASNIRVGKIFRILYHIKCMLLFVFILFQKHKE